MTLIRQENPPFALPMDPMYIVHCEFLSNRFHDNFVWHFVYSGEMTMMTPMTIMLRKYISKCKMQNDNRQYQ